MTHIRVGTTSSYREFADGHFLRARDMQWFIDHYAPEAEPADPRLAPLEVPDVHQAPPATVVLAECDPLHDDGARYAQRLREAGVSIQTHRYDGQVHPFVYFAGTCPHDATDARTKLGHALGAALLSPVGKHQPFHRALRRRQPRQHRSSPHSRQSRVIAEAHIAVDLHAPTTRTSWRG